jgi:pimeloyl-ACP methyl ester carboxylesterase
MFSYNGNAMANPAVKPLALLIPGLDGTGELFYRHQEALSRTHRVCPWNYGQGGRADLQQLTLGVGNATAGEPPGSILVVAESFGGLVALNYTLLYPERVRRLILVNTFPYYRRRMRIRAACRLAPLLRLRAIRRLREFVIDRFLSREGIRPEDRRRFQDIITRVDREGYRRRLRIILETDLRPRLPQIAVPVILLAAQKDKIVPSVVEAEFMASQIPGARVHRFADAGHALLLTPGVSLLDYV